MNTSDKFSLASSSQDAIAPRVLAFVFKSADPEWPRWGCSSPDSTRYFWNSDEAVIAAADFNAQVNGTNRQDEIAKLQIIRK